MVWVMQWAKPTCKVHIIPKAHTGRLVAPQTSVLLVCISRTQPYVGLGNVGHIHALISLFECEIQIVMQVNILYVSVPMLFGISLHRHIPEAFPYLVPADTGTWRCACNGVFIT